ncbi:hypothetical protein GUJ93_ZPchr0009g393 [Zizania palustris]|uniref:Uncharacterized protein n=1 Tax=Zizania palustris TaxID=103762 RepID=A0A8J5UY01_ZIZPA|nr:hypothetical protein GUJ93_ZPchr0009g393 [Zizania palustris]
MGQEEAAAAPAATVVFSWEQELGVSKQSPPAWQKPALKVPPPPGRLPLPLTASKSFSKARAVRPGDDPFLAAYLACTKSGGGGGGARRSVAREAKGKRRFTWSVLGLGLSCKSSNGVVENSMVRMAKLPELHPRDDLLIMFSLLNWFISPCTICFVQCLAFSRTVDNNLVIS